jgi:hypothetical protein
MDAEQMREQWGKQLVRFPRSIVAGAKVGATNRELLSEVGLPHSAAPFLSFGSQSTVGSEHRVFLPTVSQAFGVEDEQLDDFLIIGSDGGGNPIAIHTGTHDVVWLGEEEDSGVVLFVNGDVGGLLRCLSAYRDFVKRVTEEDDMAFLEDRFSDEDIDWLAERMREADARALSEGAMWSLELESMRQAVAEADES